jgi:hypothetical protein
MTLRLLNKENIRCSLVRNSRANDGDRGAWAGKYFPRFWPAAKANDPLRLDKFSRQSSTDDAVSPQSFFLTVPYLSSFNYLQPILAQRPIWRDLPVERSPGNSQFAA